MKYYLIVGEASGDLHASHLMAELKKRDTAADFRFFGGDMMSAVGGTCVKHYREMAFMGFIPVLLHLRTIFRNLALCKADILAWRPDVVILVDYPGFNLKIAKYLNSPEGKVEGRKFPVYYYISPKIWAWKEYRITAIKRDVEKLFSILPFEVPFYEKKHGYEIDYVGNPTAQEVREFRESYKEAKEEFCSRYGLDAQKDIIAVLPGSRKQEIRDNMKKMMGAIERLKPSDAQVVVAAAPGIDIDFYGKELSANLVSDTYALLSHAHAAIVVSGTATLETALFRVPQVVVYDTPVRWIIKWLRKWLLTVRWVSLVNLVADKEVVPELVADNCTVEKIAAAFAPFIAHDSAARKAQLDGYDYVLKQLGDDNAPEQTAKLIVESLI